MKLSDYLAKEKIVPNVRKGDVRQILTQLLEPLLRDGTLSDPEPMLEALLAREKVLSTGIGHGIAIPHAISSSAGPPQVILGISPEGVDYRSMDGEPVYVFFVLVSPPDRASHHTRLLARIARLGRDPDFVTGLRERADPEAAISHILEYERTHA
jgi:mannitol/fructose-specific phosphotransferase system IIA component (Ntr-type)